MKSPTLLVLAFVFQFGSAGTAEVPKTNSSLPIDPALLGIAPYCQTGLVMTSDGRGSGFVASDRKLFFSAAHVVRGDASWGGAPDWYAGVNGASTPDAGTAVASRGYFRWDKYATMRSAFGENSKQAFSNDVILAWGVADFIGSDPAVIDFLGGKRLVHQQPCMITGYPAVISYYGTTDGFFQYATTMRAEGFKSEDGPYVVATLISTGPGNSGGPVWTQDTAGHWLASGILVSGRPSESGVYTMNNTVQSLLKAAAPAIQNPRKSSVFVKGLSSTTYFWQTTKPQKIPDGVQKFTVIPLSLKRYPVEATVSKLILNLNISTTHVGDLIVLLQSPDGVQYVLHDSEGAGAHDLIFTDKNLSAEFSGAMANGRWQLKVQDRLKGDLATVNSFKLEVGTD